MDTAILILGLPILLPVLVLVYLLVLVSMGTPVFYRQLRVGRHGRPFRVFKFRTMTNDRDARGGLLPDEERLRPVGRWLRRMSLDELPQLLNVLRGQMSVVGPRAVPVEFLESMSPRYRRRHDVKPGLTGWTQVLYHGGHRTWDEKYELDLYYVDHQSLGLDAKIVLMTVRALVRRFRFNKRGVSIGTPTGESQAPNEERRT
jgi:sugar transferase EpsL